MVHQAMITSPISALTTSQRAPWIPKFSLPKDHHPAQWVADMIKLLLAQRRTDPPPQQLYQDPNLDITVEVILAAIKAKKPLLLYGDYDVDGTMSCVQWIWFFEAIGFHHHHLYIPNRSQGYGVHLDVLQNFVKKHDIQVIITMDTGITAKDEGQWCIDHGITFIVTDHHQAQAASVPESSLVVNPKLTDQTAYHYLCGASLSYLIIDRVIRLAQLELPNNFYADCLAISALATVCDVMPLWGGNRRLVQQGLACFQSSTRPVLVALRQRYCKPHEVSVHDLGFRIGPVINAVGRISDATTVVHTFVHDHDPHQLTENLERIEQHNQHRRQLTTAIFNDIQTQIHPNSLIGFYGSTEWHPGVVGIVAGRLAHLTHKPTWVFAINPTTGDCRGSVRSMPTTELADPNFNVVSAMESTAELFESFGGHNAAGGFCFKQAHQSAIATQLNAYAATLHQHHPSLWQPSVPYDCSLNDQHLTLELAQAISHLAPFGHEFAEPIFHLVGVCEKVTYSDDPLTQQPKHSALWLRLLNSTSSASAETASSPRRIMFFGHVITDLKPDDLVECLSYVRCSQFRGKLRLNIIGSTYRHMAHP